MTQEKVKQKIIIIGMKQRKRVGFSYYHKQKWVKFPFQKERNATQQSIVCSV